MKNKVTTLTHVNIYDGTSNYEILEDVSLEIKGDIISRIGNFDIDPNSKVIDCNHAYLIPGLINLHSHLPGSGKVNKTKLGNKTKLASIVSSCWLTKQIGISLVCKPSLKQALYSGVTTVRTVGGVADLDTRIRDRINKGKMKGPRLLVANYALCVEGGHMAGTVSKVINSKEDIKKCIDELASQNVDLVKIMITGGVLDGETPEIPGRLHMSEELVKYCADYAHSKSLVIAAHVEGIEGMNIALKCGINSIEHSSSFDEENVKGYKGAVVLTLSPAIPFIELDPATFGYDEIARTNSKIVLDNMLESYKLCKKHNIPIGLGTDAGSALTTHYNFYKELILFSKFTGESNLSAIHRATEVNASIAGIDNITGTIKPNLSADLLLISKDPRTSLSSLREPLMVVYRGNIIKHPHVKRNKKVEEYLSKSESLKD